MFKIGQEIVCIEDDWDFKQVIKLGFKHLIHMWPKKGKHYHCDGYSKESTTGIYLREINTFAYGVRNSFDQAAFRALNETDNATEEILKNFIPSECQPLKVNQPETIDT